MLSQSNSQPTYYDVIAPSYEELYGEEQRKKVKIIKDHIVITPNTRILDIGCGIGISSSFDCYCLGIDPSIELITQAKSSDRDPRHEYRVAKAEDIARLGFSKAQFDYAMCVSVIHHISGLEVFLQKLKPYAQQFVFTVLKKSPRKQKIITAIKRYYSVYGAVDEGKDIILFCR